MISRAQIYLRKSQHLLQLLQGDFDVQIFTNTSSFEDKFLYRFKRINSGHFVPIFPRLIHGRFIQNRFQDIIFNQLFKK